MVQPDVVSALPAIDKATENDHGLVVIDHCCVVVSRLRLVVSPRDNWVPSHDLEVKSPETRRCFIRLELGLSFWPTASKHIHLILKYN